MTPKERDLLVKTVADVAWAEMILALRKHDGPHMDSKWDKLAADEMEDAVLAWWEQAKDTWDER